MGWISDEVLESIEIRPKDKVYKLNGKDFGEGCLEFELTIRKEGMGDIEVALKTTKRTCHLSYDGRTGQKKGNPKETE